MRRRFFSDEVMSQFSMGCVLQKGLIVRAPSAQATNQECGLEREGMVDGHDLPGFEPLEDLHLPVVLRTQPNRAGVKQIVLQIDENEVVSLDSLDRGCWQQNGGFRTAGQDPGLREHVRAENSIRVGDFGAGAGHAAFFIHPSGDPCEPGLKRPTRNPISPA